MDGKIPEKSFLCIDGMMGGTLHGNLPLFKCPSMKNLRVQDLNIQFEGLHGKKCVWITKGEEKGVWETIDLTTEENWHEGNFGQALEFARHWFFDPERCSIELIQDPEKRQEAFTAYVNKQDAKRQEILQNNEN